jgi:hypothetical protein
MTVMHFRPRHHLLAWALIGGLLPSQMLVVPMARAQNTQSVPAKAHKPLSQSLTGSAKSDFEAAKLLATDGDFAGALIKFQNAYETSKDPRLLWNVAFCHKNLRHYAKVLATLKRYVEEGGQVLSANDKKEAQDLILLIEPLTTRATFKVSESGAIVSVDDERVGTSPLVSSVVLDIGERHLRVVKEGFRNFEKTLPVGGNSEVTIDVALEKEVHEGKLIVNAPANSTIFIDDKQVATGKLDQGILSGGHQIRVTAPGMHTFQTEIVIQDKETRSVDVALEPLTPAENPKLRVAVGCADSEPKAPEEGLVVYLDGPEVLPPTAVRRKWSDDQKRNVVDGVEYSISPGPHRLRVSITDCQPLDTTVNVDPQKGAQIDGALASDRFVLFRGPLGTPGLYRLGLGLWLPAGAVQFQLPEKYSGKVGAVVGAALEVGLVGRWFGAYVNGAYGKGSFSRDSYNTHYALPSSASATWDQLSLRFGPRFPFNRVALGLGVSFGVQELDLDQVRTGRKSSLVGSFVELNVQPLCDWGLFAMGKVDVPLKDEHAIPVGALHAGVYYQPNAKCRKERVTRIGLVTR